MSVNQWFHMAQVFDGKKMWLYYNGQYLKNWFQMENQVSDETLRFRIGGEFQADANGKCSTPNESTDMFQGVISDFYFYTTDLSRNQIRDLMTERVVRNPIINMHDFSSSINGVTVFPIEYTRQKYRIS